MRHFFFGFLIVFAGIFHAHADPMPSLHDDVRGDWKAIGRVNAAGFRTISGCTGTLIAPDLVLTAAHCVTNRRLGPLRHFVAGWDRGEFVAHSASDDFLLDPRFVSLQSPENGLFDIALIQLPIAIDLQLVAPIPLAESLEDPVQFSLFGYHNRRPNMLNAHTTCPLERAQKDQLWIFGCEVISGNSGGPVIVDAPNGPEIVGVIVARSQQNGGALVAPVNNWVIGHWRDALDRAKANK